jgi:phosphatidylserine/phosphatidylglycerophosphate/cardiolipin synthase-like enzyme
MNAPLSHLALAGTLALVAACQHAPSARPGAAAARSGDAGDLGPPLALVESVPTETSLDHADLPDAWQVWPAMIASARHTLDVAEFYLADSPPSRLTPVVEALLDAAARGVRIRLVADARFRRTYPELLATLAARGVAVRLLALDGLTGGVMHAKYFVVDGELAYLGSQNFDWRSLEHILELGVRVRDAELAGALEDVFAYDWALAGGEPVPLTTPRTLARRVGDATVGFVASPRELLPRGVAWDLEALVRLVDSAQRELAVQVLTFDVTDLAELEGALERALERGVSVRLVTSDWQLRPRTLAALRALDPRLAVRIVTIPQASAGFVPFARVVHAKYCVVDGERGWVGTSNWERSYFFASRNVGLTVDGGPLPPRLAALFDELWTSPYASPFDRARDYPPPRISQASRRAQLDATGVAGFR